MQIEIRKGVALHPGTFNAVVAPEKEIVAAINSNAEPAFNLVHQHIPAPSVLDCLPDIPLTLFCILHLIEQGDMMIPGNLCKADSCTIAFR